MNTFRYRKHMESIQIHKDIQKFIIEYVEKNKLFPRTKVIAEELDISESCIHKHLIILESEGILKTYGSGSHKRYELVGEYKR
jgi:Mn-dependent DtxR family transcriptional regulator